MAGKRLTNDGFADNFRRFRREAGVTQKHLAAKLGVSVDTVSRWNRGRGMPAAAHLARLAELLQVSTDELMAPSAPRAEAIQILGRTAAGRLAVEPPPEDWAEVSRMRLPGPVEVIIRQRKDPAEGGDPQSAIRNPSLLPPDPYGQCDDEA